LINFIFAASTRNLRFPLGRRKTRAVLLRIPLFGTFSAKTLTKEMFRVWNVNNTQETCLLGMQPLTQLFILLPSSLLSVQKNSTQHSLAEKTFN